MALQILSRFSSRNHNMKKTLSILLSALFAVSSNAVDLSVKVTNEFTSAVGKPISVFKNNYVDIDMALTYYGAPFNLTNNSPYFWYATSSGASNYISATCSSLVSSNGTFRAHFHPTNLNSKGIYTYGTGVSNTDGSVTTFSQGQFSVGPDAYASGAQLTNYLPVIDWSRYTWLNVPFSSNASSVVVFQGLSYTSSLGVVTLPTLTLSGLGAGSIATQGSNDFYLASNPSNFPALTQSNILIGTSAAGTEGSIGIGSNANARFEGTSVGWNSVGNSYGVGVGYGSRGYQYANGIGWGANAAFYSEAIGYVSTSAAGSVAIGYVANATNGAIALGAYANAGGAGNIAIGAAHNNGSATIPAASNFTDTVEIGVGTPSVNGALHFHGYPIVNGSGVHVGDGSGLTNLSFTGLAGATFSENAIVRYNGNGTNSPWRQRSIAPDVLPNDQVFSTVYNGFYNGTNWVVDNSNLNFYAMLYEPSYQGMVEWNLETSNARATTNSASYNGSDIAAGFPWLRPFAFSYNLTNAMGHFRANGMTYDDLDNYSVFQLAPGNQPQGTYPVLFTFLGGSNFSIAHMGGTGSNGVSLVAGPEEGKGKFVIGTYNDTPFVLGAGNRAGITFDPVGSNISVSAGWTAVGFGNPNVLTNNDTRPITLNSNLTLTALTLSTNAFSSNSISLTSTGNVLSVNAPIQASSATLGGNIGVGTTSPAQRLHVAGNGLFNGTLTAASGTFTCGLTATGAVSFVVAVTNITPASVDTNTIVVSGLANDSSTYTWDLGYFRNQNNLNHEIHTDGSLWVFYGGGNWCEAYTCTPGPTGTLTAVNTVWVYAAANTEGENGAYARDTDRSIWTNAATYIQVDAGSFLLRANAGTELYTGTTLNGPWTKIDGADTIASYYPDQTGGVSVFGMTATTNITFATVTARQILDCVNGVFSNGIASAATNSAEIAATGWTNTLGICVRVMGLTGSDVIQTNTFTGRGKTRGTITVPTDLLLQPGEILIGTSMVSLGVEGL